MRFCPSLSCYLLCLGLNILLSAAPCTHWTWTITTGDVRPHVQQYDGRRRRRLIRWLIAKEGVRQVRSILLATEHHSLAEGKKTNACRCWTSPCEGPVQQVLPVKVVRHKFQCSKHETLPNQLSSHEHHICCMTHLYLICMFSLWEQHKVYGYQFLGIVNSNPDDLCILDCRVTRQFTTEIIISHYRNLYANLIQIMCWKYS